MFNNIKDKLKLAVAFVDNTQFVAGFTAGVVVTSILFSL